jgi:hypothetical protein
MSYRTKTAPGHVAASVEAAVERHKAALLRGPTSSSSGRGGSTSSLSLSLGTPGTRRSRRAVLSPPRNGGGRLGGATAAASALSASSPPPAAAMAREKAPARLLLPSPSPSTSSFPASRGALAPLSRHLAFSKALGGALARVARRSAQGIVRDARAAELRIARGRVSERQGERDGRRALLKVRLMREDLLRARLAEDERKAVGRAVEAAEVAALGVLLEEREGRR